MKQAGKSKREYSGGTKSDNKMSCIFAKVGRIFLCAPQQLKPPRRLWFISCWGDAYRRAVEPQLTPCVRFRKSP